MIMMTSDCLRFEVAPDNGFRHVGRNKNMKDGAAGVNGAILLSGTISCLNSRIIRG